MAIEAIKKIYLLGYKEIEGEVISLLQDLGVVEISELLPEYKEETERLENKELQGKLEQLEYLINLLGKYVPRKGGLETTGKERIVLSQREFQEIVENFDFFKIYQNCRNLEKELDELKIKRNKLETEKHQITPWLPLQTKLERFTPTAKVGISLGHIPLNQCNRFKKEIFDLTDEILLYEINTDKKWKYILLFYSREYGTAIEEILKKVEFTPLYHPLVNLSPEEIILRINQGIETTHKEEQKAISTLSELVPLQSRLKVIYDYHLNLQIKEKIKQFFTRTNESFCLTGWIPAKEIDKIKRILSNKFAYLEIIFANPEEKERVPVILKNKKIAEPFEVITDLYGRPKYRGVDPTPYLSIFFAIFFGLCLTDAGYGIVLMLLSGLVLLRYSARMGLTSRKFFRLFFLGGFATLLLGAMVGGWFGMTAKIKLFDPLKDLLIFFALALGLGIVHIFTGLSIRMWQNIKSGDWVAALSDQGLWMVIISSLIVFGLVKGKTLPANFESPSKICSIGTALGIIFFQGRRVDKNLIRLSGLEAIIYPWLWLILTIGMTSLLLKLFLPLSRYLALFSFLGIVLLGRKNLKGIFGRIGLGLYSLYGISGFLGDTLSYSRLVALGLTTGIVAMVINRMAAIANLAPYVGFLLAFFILLVGHAFNIAINLLGAFVHSCRLQYVEFFTKFYESGGKPFQPFAKTGKYTLISD